MTGSADVLIDSRRALRVGDVGVHAACCGPNVWVAVTGASHVLINGRKAHRQGDFDRHCGGPGITVTGSSHVLIGDKG